MYASPIFSSVQVMNPLKYPSTRTQHGCLLHHSSSSNNKSHRHTIVSFCHKRRQSISSIKAVDDVSTIISGPAQTTEITWQIVIGALAGVTPFVVAGIEFSKRIVAQRKCEVCKGSGLVLRDNKYYFRCPRCGGFLPWQSWRRFFTG